MLQIVKRLKKIVIIAKDCKKKKKKNNVSSRMTLSSNINEGIREVLFFKRKDFARTKSAKSTKLKQATFTQMFFMRTKNAKSTKRTKSTKRQTSNLPLRCFLCA